MYIYIYIYTYVSIYVCIYYIYIYIYIYKIWTVKDGVSSKEKGFSLVCLVSLVKLSTEN